MQDHIMDSKNNIIPTVVPTTIVCNAPIIYNRITLAVIYEML